MIKINIKKELRNINLDVNINVNQGDFLCLSGKSGSGKTTLLRIIAGLETAQGKIEVANKTWLDDSSFLKVQKREVGFVFQDYALFDNMSVENNLLYINKDKELASYLLNTTELYKLKNQKPNTLSGGQKQRLSLCRAFMNKPKILLLDEPLSALDVEIREKLQNEILQLHSEFKTTTIMVSHDPSEIYKLSSKVALIEDGFIKELGSAKEILLKTKGSAKFSLEGRLLEIVKVDVIYIAVVAIGQQLVEVVISKEELSTLKIGQIVSVSTKAFTPSISSI